MLYKEIRRKKETPVLMQKKKGEVEYLTFPGIESTGLVNHLFSTRRQMLSALTKPIPQIFAL